MDSDYLLPAIVAAPLLWVLAILIIGLLTGMFFAVSSIFCCRPWKAFACLAERNPKLDKASPLVICGLVLLFPLSDYFDQGRNVAQPFLPI